MESILNTLYNYENFSLYLIIAIIVLVILFIIILFYGKKDKRVREIEVTRKLQQINSEDAFKETTVPEPAQVNPNVNALNGDTIIVPNLNNLGREQAMPTEEVPVAPAPAPTFERKVEPVNEYPNYYNAPNDIAMNNNYNTEVREQVAPLEPKQMMEEARPVVEPTFDNAPILDRVEEKPLVINQFESQMEERAEKVPEVNIPVFNYEASQRDLEEKVMPEAPRSPEVFSSVYAPEEHKTEEAPKPEVDGMELPALKKEEASKEEVKPFDGVNIDNISGEYYKINK